MDIGRTILYLLPVLSVFLWGTERAQSQKKSEDKSETIYIPSDLLPPPSTEQVLPRSPFFTEPTTGNEVLEYVEALKVRVDKLEHMVEMLNRQMQVLQKKVEGSAQK